MPSWAADAFAWAVDRGLVTGTPAGSGGLLLSPQGNATRCQGAALFLRLLQNLEQGQETGGAAPTDGETAPTDGETAPTDAETASTGTESAPTDTETGPSPTEN